MQNSFKEVEGKEESFNFIVRVIVGQTGLMRGNKAGNVTLHFRQFRP